MGLWELYNPKKEFYKSYPKPTNSTPEPGQLCWAPIPFHDDPWLINIGRATSTSHDSMSGTLERPTSSAFNSKTKLPLTHLKLASTEEFLGFKTKKRPAIVVGPLTSGGVLTPIQHQSSHHPGYLVVPIYSVATTQKPTSLSQEHLLNARTMKNLIHFPCPKLAGILEENGIARLDKISVCHQYNGWLEWTDVGLNKDLLKIILAMIRQLFASTNETDLNDLRQVLKDADPQS